MTLDYYDNRLITSDIFQNVDTQVESKKLPKFKT